MSARSRRSARERAVIAHRTNHRPLVTGSAVAVSTVVKAPAMALRDAVGDSGPNAPEWVYVRTGSVSSDRAALRRKDVGQHWAQSFPDARYRATSAGFAPADAVAR